MIRVKTFDIISGHISYVNRRPVSIAEAISTIKERREKGDTGVVEIDYIGSETIDFEPTKLRCDICRDEFEGELRGEREL